MKIPFRYFLPAIFLLFSFFSEAQTIKKFSADPKNYETEIRAFFKDIQVEATKQTLENFAKLVKSNAFTVEEFAAIVEMSNLMLKERMKPTPEFEAYFNNLIAYKANNIGYDKFQQWQQVQQKVITTLKKEYSGFSGCIYALFTKNALTSSESKSWILNTSDYNIEMDKRPYIRVGHPIDLWCRTAEDTLIIYGTSGVFDIISDRWKGEKGKVTWQRVGLDTNKVYSLVRDYSVDVKKSELIADSAIFYNKNYVNAPIIGQLHDMAMTRFLGRNANYPKFESYDAVYILTKLSKNLLYIGGISMEGINIMGTGKPEQKAKILISWKGHEVLKAESETFMITPEKIVANAASVTIYYDQDSMFHPKIIFNYQIKERKLVMTRGEEGLYRSPMFNNYHKVDMEFDQIIWKVDEALMDIKLFSGSKGSSVFTSNEFFTFATYMQTQGVLTYHPLEKIKGLAMKLNRNTYTIDEFASYMSLKPEYVEALLIRLSMNGFIIYNINTGVIMVRDKSFLYVNAANNKTDYDMLRFESVTTSKSNAVFSLNSGNLNLEGVTCVYLSDTHKVYVVPDEQKLTLKQNRNFEFSGYVRAGRFEFFGHKFNFDYDNFKVNMNNIDSARFYIPVENVNPEIKKKILVRIQNVIQNVSGYLYIDHPKNKSARINYPEYPIFECTKKSYVYFDHPRILGGVYNRDRFYFELKPFTIDSLDKFNIEGLKFDGTFYSADILPVFEYYLMPQVDLSLGFVKTDKFPLYLKNGGNKGKGDLQISLSNDGLRGSGSIDYLTSITQSKDFVFYIDSMKTTSQTFNIEHNALGKYPKVVGTDNYIRWLCYRDTMIIKQRTKPFYIYEKGIEFNGNLVLTPQKLSSSGTFNYTNSEITSASFIFTPNKLLSDTANIRIKSNVDGVYAFVAPKINLDLDVKKDIMTGESTQSSFRIQFPVNKYLTSQRKFTWNIPQQKIELSKGKLQTDKDLYMLSTDSKQDSLKFTSLNSTYDINTFTLFAHKVPFIPVADARIYPDSNEVTLFKNAEMKSLQKAEIKVDTVHYYHRIYNAYVNVFGKYKYTGYGTYDYVDKYKKKQPIFFYQIRVDETRRTFAKGKIADTTDFYISPYFKYHGNIELNGNIKEMSYDGFILPYHKIAKARTTWFAVQNRINPDSVIFNIYEPKDQNGKNLYTGVYLTNDSPYVYHVFMGKLKVYSDLAISESNKGVLYYDDKKDAFILADEDKIFNNQRRGSYFELDTKTGDVHTEGKIDFGCDVKALELKSAGQIVYIAADNRYLFDVVMTINFPFDNNALKKMSSLLIETAFNRKDAKEQRDVVKNAVAELVENEKERKNYMRDLDEGSLIKPEKTLAKTFFITEMQLTWDLKTKSFISVENTIGLNSVNKTLISKELEGGFQIARRRSGIVLNLYMSPDQNNYFYFKYTYGIFSALAADLDFNNIVRTTANKFSQPKFRIKTASNREMEQFLNIIKPK